MMIPPNPTTGLKVSEYNETIGKGSQINKKHARITFDIFF